MGILNNLRESAQKGRDEREAIVGKAEGRSMDEGIASMITGAETQQEVKTNADKIAENTTFEGKKRLAEIAGGALRSLEKIATGNPAVEAARAQIQKLQAQRQAALEGPEMAAKREIERLNREGKWIDSGIS
ncbi:MAG: hypothetical protein ABII07_04915 [Patescibacteria group bacterium]|nr:hypothetical protein [Patescibacteria group bacterium]